jgi:5-methylthioadenosine/S-adenosylhomocysteine deaminase
MTDTLITGGTIVTMGPRGVIEGNLYIADGRIAAVGETPADAATVIDARGALVVPGFVQAHVHLCQTLFRGLADDLEVVDWLRLRIWPFEQAHDRDSMYASARLGAAELALGGTTAALSMESVHHTDASFEAVADIGIRAIIGKALMDYWEPGTEMIGEDTDTAWDDARRLVEKWHGAADGRLGVALSPRGPRNATPEMWRRCVELAAEADLRLHTHVNESREQAIRLGKRPEGRDIVALDGWGALSDRLVMAHSVWLDDRERDLVRRHRPHVCHCPSANLKLASGIAPIPGYLDDGINVALGADGPPCNNRLDIFAEMRLAALIQKPTHGPTAMPASTALEMATMGGARALGLAHEIGSLETGKAGDVVLVDRGGLHSSPHSGGDPISDLVYAHQPSDVTTVLVDGAPIVVDRGLVAADRAEIVADAEQRRAELIARLD